MGSYHFHILISLPSNSSLSTRFLHICACFSYCFILPSTTFSFIFHCTHSSQLRSSTFHLPPSSPLFTPLSSSPPALLPLFISSSFPSAILILFIFLFHPPFRHHLCSTHFLFLNACSIHFSSYSSSLSLYFFHIPLSLPLFHLPSFLHILIYLFFLSSIILIYRSLLMYLFYLSSILSLFHLYSLRLHHLPPPPQFTPPSPPITGVLNIGSSSLEGGGRLGVSENQMKINGYFFILFTSITCKVVLV